MWVVRELFLGDYARLAIWHSLVIYFLSLTAKKILSRLTIWEQLGMPLVSGICICTPGILEWRMKGVLPL
jgi:hypothetical protein